MSIESSAWFIQATFENFPLAKHLEPNKQFTWIINSYFKRVKEGDTVYFWQAGKNQGLYGKGIVTGGPYIESSDEEGKPQHRLPLTCIKKFDEFISKDEFLLELEKLAEDGETALKSILKNKLFSVRAGSIFPIEPEFAALIERLLDGTIPDPIPLEPDFKTDISDDSTRTNDHFGRTPIAEGLAVTLRKLYATNSKLSKESFRILLHGMWGTGKSTFMHLLKLALQPNKTKSKNGNLKDEKLSDENEDWVVIEFDAWQQQRTKPIWWSFYNTIYDGILETLVNSKGEKSETGKKLKKEEKKWRNSYRSQKLIWGLTIIGTILLFSLIAMLLGLPGYEFLKIVTGLLSLSSAALVLYKHVQGDQSLGSREEMLIFSRRSDDPYNKLRQRFEALLDTSKKPLMIYVDNLDRCTADYVVELLEVIQTVFNDSRAYFLIAADKRWIQIAYETIYSDMKENVYEPGKDMGELFLEKIFQLDIIVPEISREQKSNFLNFLLSRNGEIPTKTLNIDIESEIKDDNANELFNRLNNKDLDIGSKAAVSEKLAVELNTASTQREIEHFLQPFSDFLDNNPRAMKRYINAYTLVLTVAVVLIPSEVATGAMRKKLALWMIIVSRWPSIVSPIKEAISKATSSEVNLLELKLEKEKNLLAIDLEEVQKVWNGKGNNEEKALESLDIKSVKSFLRLTQAT